VGKDLRPQGGGALEDVLGLLGIIPEVLLSCLLLQCFYLLALPG